MRTFTKTQQRKFVDSVYSLNMDKDFKGTFVDSLKGSITFKEVDETLKRKRISYNHAIVNLFDCYSITPDDLYLELDRIWEDLPSAFEFFKSYTNQLFPNKGISQLLKEASSITIALTAFTGVSTIVVLSIAQYIVRSKWEGYKTGVLKYCDEYSLKKLEEVNDARK